MSRARAYSTSSPEKDATSTPGTSETASFSMATRSSTPNRGSLPGLARTATTTASKQRLARWMMSTWPLVTGSKVPGHRAVRPILVCLLRSRDTEYEDDAVPVGEPSFELPVYWNYRHVSSRGAAQHHPATRVHHPLSCYFGEQCLEVGLLQPVRRVQHDQVEGPPPLPDCAERLGAPNPPPPDQLGP